jgi:hypothetical protein
LNATEAAAKLVPSVIFGTDWDPTTTAGKQ